MRTIEDILMTRQEVADFLKVSLRTADTFLRNKDFDGVVHIGRNVRVLKSKLIRYLDRKTY